MLRSRYDRISDLVDLYQRLDSLNINSVLENPTPVIIGDIEQIREFLKTEIESFATWIIDGLLNLNGTMDIKFVGKVIEYSPNFLGEVLAKSISQYYTEIGFDSFHKMVVEIKNNISVIYGIEALFNEIIIDGEKHRDEACALTTKLEEITSSEDFNTLSDEQMIKVKNMIERLKPHARPVIRKMFYREGMTLKKGEENGCSYPIFSRSGNWMEHDLVMSAIHHSFEEQNKTIKKILKK